MGIMQVEKVSIDGLVSKNHAYRKLKEQIDFDKLVKSISIKEKEAGAIGYGIRRLTMCLILQFMENLSDREFDRFMTENVVGKWFCDFGILEKTPDITTIYKFRNKLGSEEIEKIFNAAREQRKSKGYLAEVFTFVDATALLSKLSMWEERDKAISEGYEKFSNEVIEKYSKDKEVRIGAKSGTKFWFGFKKHVSVDMQSGLINKVKVTKANVTDADGLEDACPDGGAVSADKGYVPAIETIRKKGCHPHGNSKKQHERKEPR